MTDTTARPDLLGTLETALYADDLDAARAFWGDIIGLSEVVHVPGRHVFFRTALQPLPQMLLIFQPDATARPPGPQARLPVPPHGAQGPGHVCLAVAPDALDGWRAYLEAQDIGIEADFEWPNGARSLYFRDPAGNSVELADPSIWAPNDPASED